MSNLALFFTWRLFSEKLFYNLFSLGMSLPRRVLMNCQKMDFIGSIALKVIFQGSKGQKKYQIWLFCFCQFSQKQSSRSESLVWTIFP